MDVQENCIQLKIDTIISDINQNGQDNQNEEKNQITALMGYSHCLDLFDFLQLYSKIQKNELLFQTAIIYDSIGYTELSMDYINESLVLIPNVPSIILYKSGLFASLNKLDEAQKWLLKYKYLIGEKEYDNYIHDSILIMFYYLLEYEEHIILRKISSIEDKYNNYMKDNVVLFYIKSKTLEKLAQKFKNSDNKRYTSYIKESKNINNKYINNKKSKNEILIEQGIRNENITKLMILINPNFLKYKPKKLIEYKNGFTKSGFSLFYTLIKICKMLKLKIEAKKYQKRFIKNNNESKFNTNNNSMKSIKDIIKNIKEKSYSIDLVEESNDKSYQESIRNLCNSIWLREYMNNANKENILKEDKTINKNITKIIKTNYYINEGYYSHLNLKKSILKNIEYNNDYKNNKLDYDSFYEDINSLNNDEIKVVLDNKSSKNDIIINKSNAINNNINNNMNNNITNDIKNSKKQMKKIQINNKNKTKTIKNSLSDIIKQVVAGRPKEINKNKRNKINNNNNNDNKESKKTKKFCSTDNYNNQKLSKTINKDKIDLIENESKPFLSKVKEEKPNVIKKVNKEAKSRTEKDKDKENLENKDNNKQENKIKEDKNSNKIQKDKKSYTVDRKNNNKEEIIEKKKNEMDLTNINHKNEILSINTSKKKISIINSNDQIKPLNKNIHNNQTCSLHEKKMDTDYGKYKDVKEINLVSYCLKQLIKKKENKNKNNKQKEITNLTDKIDLMIPQKMIDLEKQILQINEYKFLKSQSKKKKLFNQSIKKQINTFTFEKKMKKNTQKNSDNNMINSNKSSYNNSINLNNMKNLKKTINNYGYKKEISKFKSLNYLHGNFYANNNYLNINFNNYMNYNFNYSNRHEKNKKNLDFRYNPNSDIKKRDSSYSKEKPNFRTINLDFKNMSTKLNKYSKKPLLNSFIDSKDKNKKSSDNKHDFSLMPFNKIKNSPSSEMTCLKRKLKNIKSNLIKQKTKTSFSKYMLYNPVKKTDAFYFSKSINTSEYNKYKNSSINKSKNTNSKYKITKKNISNSKLNIK